MVTGRSAIRTRRKFNLRLDRIFAGPLLSGNNISKSAGEITSDAPKINRAHGAEFPAAAPSPPLSCAEACRAFWVGQWVLDDRNSGASNAVGAFGVEGHGRLLEANRVSVLTNICVLNSDSSNLTILLA